MKTEIPVILCKLEKIFPPAFFDVMVHLAVHLPDEAMVRGPVQFGWMYPIERRLYTLKRVDEAGLLVDLLEVARLRKENESKTTSEDEGDEVEDDTLMEYLSEEEAVPVEVDSDDE
ncbi:unnamed protein product [Miscanthus lutarioriparius]|uniref:DUF4218 domain-containing protein n=1 Tax=Miscanthus lutarioriparius TaxID=422564 RepID=A0A811QYP4_9POAL|nr:unnamed protein product [Miscanthus lutarioriparius]